MPETVESNPHPALVAEIAGIVRAILATLGGMGFMWAYAVTADQVTMIVSLLVTVGVSVWSLVQKRLAAKREHQIAVMSARGGKAVQPESTPV